MNSIYLKYQSLLTISKSMPMPGELSWSDACDSQFWSKRDDESQHLLSEMPITSETIRENGTTKEKIKRWLECARIGNCLLQFWAPVMIGGRRYLTTADQPFALREILLELCSYRVHCLDYLISVGDEICTQEEYLGPPGRVFRNGLPEMSFDVLHYSTEEYPQRDFAVSLGVRRYLALPVFEPPRYNCIGVIELVDMANPFGFCPFGSWPGLDRLVEDVMRSLKVENLTSDIYRDLGIETKTGPEDAINEIEKVLKVVCETHQLRFAQAWVPNSDSTRLEKIRIPEKRFSLYESEICEESYILDTEVRDFAEACSICCLKKGQGVVGKAFSSEGACFCKDIRMLHISNYPLVSSARKAKLSGCFAICLRYIGGGDYVYMVEFFLPLHEIGIHDPRPLMKRLFATITQQFKSFKVASGQNLGERLFVEVMKISSADKLDSFEICHFRGLRSAYTPANSLHKELAQFDEATNNVENINVLGGGTFKNLEMQAIVTTSSSPLETRVSMPKHFVRSSHENHDFAREILNESLEASPSTMDPREDINIASRALDHGEANELSKANKLRKMIDIWQTDSSSQQEGMLHNLIEPSQDFQNDTVSSVIEDFTTSPMEIDIWESDSSCQQEGMLHNLTPNQIFLNVDASCPAEVLTTSPTEVAVERARIVKYPPRIQSPVKEKCTLEIFREERSAGGRSPLRIESPIRGVVEPDTSCAQPPLILDEINRANQAGSKQDYTTSSRKRGAVRTLGMEYEIDLPRLKQYSDKKLAEVANILEVSRSTLKRICRKHGIFRWPPYKARNRECNLKNSVQATKGDVKDQRTEYESFSNLAEDSSSKARALQSGRMVHDGSNNIMMVKASYKDLMIRFELSCTSKKLDVEKEVAKRLNLSIGSFDVKYLDDENDWILLACDADLKLCASKSSGNAVIKMRVGLCN